MSSHQPGIMEPVPSLSRYLEFIALPEADVVPGLEVLKNMAGDDGLVIGLGAGLVLGLDASIDGLRTFPSMSGRGSEVPSTQADLWVWVRGEDRGDIFHRGRAVIDHLASCFRLDHMVDGFKYGRGQDLTGYEDGTENPVGDEAVDAALVAGHGPGLDGSSFVAVQQWAHDLDHFDHIDQDDKDSNIIGRRLSDNEELEDAAATAHVKRTSASQFEPRSVILRRSMPWADASGEGLVFVAFGRTLDAFEVQLRHMIGEDDNVVDGLFRFTRPISGGYFWCPPVAGGSLDLSAIGL
ncbi:MAG: Dyp-type peroxidase [Pseudomonadota bacterium]